MVPRWECRAAMPQSQSRFLPYWEDDAMTLQVAIRASDGFVLASDLSTRTSESVFPSASVAEYARYHPKTRINQKHGIAFALAGFEPSDVDVLDDFNAMLTAATIPTDFASWLEAWAIDYVTQHRAIACSLLIVNPAADASRIVELLLSQDKCRAVPDL